MTRYRAVHLCLLACAWLLSGLAVAQGDPATLEQYRDWIEHMKQAERGPFARIQWFCNDGSIQPPVSFGCKDHERGYQHGEWNARTLELRQNGYKVANLLAGIDATAALQQADFADTFGQILVEKYLVGIDDGWILRQALFYRGAIQDEDERAGARALLQAMAADEYWLTAGFPALRTGARALPHGAGNASIQVMRQLSASLSEQDPAFKPLRAKIHGAPDADDARRVRDYAASKAPAELVPDYQQLALEIDAVYRHSPFSDLLQERADTYNLAPWLQDMLRGAADRFSSDPGPLNRFRVTANLLGELREAMPRINSPQVRVQALDLGLRAELEHFLAATQLRPLLPEMSRQELLALLFSSARAAYGAGLLNPRLTGEIEALSPLDAEPQVSLARYTSALSYLARAPGWGMQTLRMHFQQSMNTLAQLQPEAQLFIQDQLRASPLLFYADVLDLLMRDANRLLGVKHHLFGQDVGFGLAALNPGMARGILYADPAGAYRAFAADGIYLLPETVAELPPIAGILTAGEGNPLSHIQLLARNLGIPNVVVSDALIGAVAGHNGSAVVLAVSPSGLIDLSEDGPSWDRWFPARGAETKAIIHPDLDKLDLSETRVLPLDELRAGDSGRIVGPKAAKLGELKAHYPAAVARGIAIPFGVFNRDVLLQPWAGDTSGRTTVFAWMSSQYEALHALPTGSAERDEAAERFRSELYDIVASTPIRPALRQALQQALLDTFGPGEPPGLFIRSDTNVEDLPGFTGAGLNLTLPNVVGLDALLQGIPRVWASPFTARAFSWRQSLMSQPEHVYTSILLLESVPVDKSGVLVTQDIDSGDGAVLSVAVNEGPGGAVDGQAAESLRIAIDGSWVRVLATATAPERRVLSASGGVSTVPASGSDTVLQPGEIAQLIEFSLQLPETFPPILDELGQPAPADVEFGFLDGELRLFQIRPFLDSQTARSSDYLRRMDASLSGQEGRMVDLAERPQP